MAGDYLFDVAEARHGGSAGATSLILQTILLPLALAAGPSSVTLRGGTHVAWSPPFDYVRDVYLPALARLGIEAGATLQAWGWYPAGLGEIQLWTAGGAELHAASFDQRGPLRRIHGLAVAANLPSHIPQRMANRARNLLRDAGLKGEITPQRVQAASPGAGIFLTAEYEGVAAGFSALGARGKPSEAIAAEAVEALLSYHTSEYALDEHLSDQLVVPLALAPAPVSFTTVNLSQHTLTNLWVVERFLGRQATIDWTAHRVSLG